MAENSVFAILLRSRWWISFVVAAVLGVAAAALLPDAYRIAGATAALPFVVIGVIAARRQWRLPSRARIAQTQEALSDMSWSQFAELLDAAFRRDGYEVRRTAGGAFDFELERGGRKTLVCARRWKSARTGLEALRALHEARESSDATDALYVCLGELTDNARPFASAQRVTVWQAAELAQALGADLRRG